MTDLQAKNLFIGYNKKVIVEDISLHIPKGKVIGLIGSNGSGKSTLLKALARVLHMQAGEILLDDQAIQKIATKEVAKKISLLSQTSEVGVGLRVRDVVSYGRFPYQKGLGRLDKKDYDAINWALEATGLLSLADQKVNALSGGQRQRVWIAMSLAQDTEIVILDEPTTFLDPAHQLEILQLLKKINETKNKTIIMSIHDLNHASRFCDYIYALKSGKLIVEGCPEEVITNYWLNELFEIDALIGTFPNSTKPLVMTYELRGEQ